MLRQFTLILVFLTAGSTSVSAVDPLYYEVSFSDASNHYLQIKATIPAVDAKQTILMIPTWTPGSYLMREYARNIDHIAANDESGQPLKLEKVSRNRWQVTGGTGGKIIVSYRLYCHEMSVRTNWVDSDLAIINGAATFLTVPQRRNHPHVVSLKLPKSWSKGVCSLEEVLPGTCWSATMFEELVDNPIIAGNPVTQDFEAGGRSHQLVSLGDTSLWELKTAAEDVRKIVDQHQRMFAGQSDASPPYDEYQFLNLITEGRGGLEHDKCTLVMTSRWNFRDEEKYEDWLSLVSHEFFHTWNVRRLRPAGIWQYHLEKENYTSSLWIAEGVTSYYEDIALVRAGIIDRDQYLARISKVIKSLQTGEGRLVQSLTDSSYDTWIKFYRPDENSKNSRVSYYTKGAVVAFLLDAKIRLATDGKKCLDDVMRQMYDTFAGQRGYTEQDFRDTASQVAGENLNPWFKTHIDGANELNYEPALTYWGLQFQVPKTGRDSTPKKSDDSQQEVDQKPADKKETSKAKVDVGITFSSSSNLTISAIRSNSAAFKAGLNVGDEVVAMNDYRTLKSNWDSQLKAFLKDTGQPVQVTVSRRGHLRTISLSLEEADQATWKLQVVKKPTEQQQQRQIEWLHLKDAPAEKGNEK